MDLYSKKEKSSIEANGAQTKTPEHRLLLVERLAIFLGQHISGSANSYNNIINWDSGSHIDGGNNVNQYQNNDHPMAYRCENSDPYKLYAMLKNLEQDQIGKIKKIILYDDVNASTAWSILNEFTSLTVEHILIQRLKENKSLTDMTLAVGVCKEFYGGVADSFVLLSSDSDYWALIKMLPESRFLVMVETEKVSPDMCKAMEDSGIFYCFIDDFFTGNSDEIRMRAVLDELQERLDEKVNFNINALMKEVFWATRVEMGTREERRFYDRYLKKMKLAIDMDGNVSVKLDI